MTPDYKLIYTDIIKEKYPHKINDLKIKSKIDNINNVLDILALNEFIFEDTDQNIEIENQKLRSYDENSILKILLYQKSHNLNNTEVSNHFKMSRNTLTKWKKIFKI